MSFCSKCVELEAQMEIQSNKHYEEVQKLKDLVKRLEDQVESLTLDLAFYGGNVINLSCNDK